MRIADGVLDRFNADGPHQALTWLRGQPNVEHAIGDGVAFRFRLAGGRPVWVLTARALGYDESAPQSATHENVEEPTAASLAGLALSTVDAGRWLVTGLASPRPGSRAPAPTVDPVGRDRDGDEKLTDRDPRRALVLDPFLWEWSRLTSYDYREGVEVARILEDTPGFDHGVVRYLPDHRATESAFTGWDDYDVVHFSGHGHRICEYDGCYSMIFTGDTVSSDGVFDDSTLGLGRETGVMEIRDPDTNNVLVQKRHVAIGREWFQHHYDPGDLDGTLIYLSGCGTMNPGDAFLPDFLAPLMGDRGATAIGWTGVVPGRPAQTAAVEFYTRASERRWRAGDIVEELANQGLTTTTNSDGGTVSIRTGSASGEGFSQAPARLTEVVALHGPESVRLTDGPQPRTTLRGIPGDGKSDTLSVDVVLEGVRADELDAWSVELVLRGNVVRRGLEPTAEQKEGDYRYRIPVRELDLGIDLTEGRADTLEAVARLPEGGESRTLAVIELTSSYFAYSVNGDAQGDQTGWIWVSTDSPPRADPTSGLCLATIHFVPAARGTGLAGLTAMPLFGLTIGTYGGLQVGQYAVGVDESYGMDQLRMRESNPGTFFAGLTARLVSPASEQSVAWGVGAAGFFSTGGHVSIDHVDSTRIEGSFHVTARGLEPLDDCGDCMQFVEATASGDFAGPFAIDPSRRLIERINEPYETVYNCAPGA